MRVILLGPPGCGKGTQANLLCSRLHLEHIGTGDILRQAIRDETPAGLRAKPYVERGGLVPDELVNDLIADRFRSGSRPESFVLDGYPRTVGQAEALDGVLREQGLNLDAVVLIEVDDEEIVRRVAGRWSCPKPGCKATYHIESNSPRVAGVCDYCKTPLVQRADDKPETVRERLRIYHRDTTELIPYYNARGLVREVSGRGPIEMVYARIEQALGPRAGRGS
jgi:adenylate kinase